MILCRVLGPVSLEINGDPAPPELLWRKHLALLVYLARSPKRGRSREHLIGMLWPEKDASAARHSLNEALRVLRRAAGEQALEATAAQVRLAGDAVRLDTEELEHCIATQAWQQAAGLIAGEFLEGFGIAGATEFEDWLGAERVRWRERSLIALLGCSEVLLREGSAHEALAAARRAEALAPCSDLVARAIMSALAVAGDSAAATLHYERFAALLKRETGAAPAEATGILLARIRSSKGPRPQESTTGQPDRRRAPLLGRTGQLALLQSYWERCRNGEGASVLLLQGDSGSGKSRLLQEFQSRVRLGAGALAFTRAIEADLTEPGSGALGLARGGLLDAAGVSGAAPAALAAFADCLPEWADRFRASAPAGGKLALSQALRAVLEAVVESGPLVLLVDDAQWMDRESLLALLSAHRDVSRAPLFLVLAALSEPPREELDALRHRLGRDFPGERLGLGPLDSQALRALAAWALPDYDAVALERVCRRVASDSAGLPLLAVELLSAVAQGLDLQQGAAAWPEPLRTLTQTLPGDLPDTVVAALRIGFRRLSPLAQQVLVAAAVLGDRVTERALARATGCEPAALQQALDELEWQRWLEADTRGYGFVARLARAVIARDMVTPGQRARLLERTSS